MEFNQITFTYDRKVNQLQDVTGCIAEGKITAIIGPNGSGKSTLLSAMAKNIKPQSGSVVLDGKEIAAYKPRELARKLAVVHQQNDAPADLTVERLAAYGRLPYQSMFSQKEQEDKAAIEWALECTNLLFKRS